MLFENYYLLQDLYVHIVDMNKCIRMCIHYMQVVQKINIVFKSILHIRSGA